MLWGGIETGGTKFICAVGTSEGEIVAEAKFRTATPQETMAQVIEFFLKQRQNIGPLKAIGIGSFGPLDLDRSSQTFGFITTAPKTKWMHTDLAGIVERNLEVPVGIDTDVNLAALAENRWGAATGLHTFIYLTVGTGIGGGGMVNGNLMHGLTHPEMGHIMVPHDIAEDSFPGICTFHRDCLEGLAAGPAIKARWGTEPDKLTKDHPAWALEAKYLALGLVNYICTISPQRIIMGGGVMEQPQLFPLVRKNVMGILNGYISIPEILECIDDYIVPPLLGSRAGVLGAIAFAMQVSP